MTEIFEIIVPILISVFIGVSLLLFKNFIDKSKIKLEEKEIKDNVEKVVSIFTAQEEETDSALASMVKNVAELREYYIINKQQARNS
ncbi:MAG: hypothetical protein AAF617_16310, partial [Bacteroidota bacterium]